MRACSTLSYCRASSVAFVFGYLIGSEFWILALKCMFTILQLREHALLGLLTCAGIQVDFRQLPTPCNISAKSHVYRSSCTAWFPLTNRQDHCPSIHYRSTRCTPNMGSHRVQPVLEAIRWLPAFYGSNPMEHYIESTIELLMCYREWSEIILVENFTISPPYRRDNVVIVRHRWNRWLTITSPDLLCKKSWYINAYWEYHNRTLNKTLLFKV